jgi:hypothetical protein
MATFLFTYSNGMFSISPDGMFSISPEMQATWDDIMGQMCAFVNDTNADIDSAYDWVCEMLEIDSFVDNEGAWDSFYDAWESCDNRNDLRNIYID